MTTYDDYVLLISHDYRGQVIGGNEAKSEAVHQN